MASRSSFAMAMLKWAYSFRLTMPNFWNPSKIIWTIKPPMLHWRSLENPFPTINCAANWDWLNRRLTVDVFSVPHVDNQHNQLVVVDFVNHSIVTDSNSES